MTLSVIKDIIVSKKVVFYLSRTDYGSLSDNTLAALTKKGDGKAFEEIYIRYIKLIYTIASKYHVDGYGIEDLVQECLLAFLIACKTYDEKQKTSFKSYAVKCAKNRISDLIKKVNAKSSVPDSKLVSIDTLNNAETDSVEDYLMEREYLRTLFNHIEKLLTAEERRVYKLYSQGYSYKEIAEETNSTPKKIDNILQKIKKKLREDL